MLDKIIKYTIYTFTVLFPIFSLPITPESYEVNKMMLFIVTTLILLLLLSLKVIKEKKIVIIHSAFTIPFFFLALLTLISTLFQSSNPILALTTPLSTSTIITGFVFYILLTQVFEQAGDARIIHENGGDASGGPPISAHLRAKASEEHLMGVTRGRTPILLSLTISFLILLLLPVQLPFLVLTVIFLAAASPKNIKQFTLPIANKLTLSLTLALLVVSTLLIYWPLKSYASDVLLRLSLVSNSNLLLGDALNFSQKSIEFNPYSEKAFSLSSTLTLEALRNVVQTSNVPDSTEIVKSLSDQAITHAKKTTELNPQKSENWGLVGDTYQSLTGIAENANTWALNAYNQQMLLNPYSPQAKVSAGGLSMTAGDHETAALLFRQAINLKPDWNNAHYNLAVLYTKTGNYNYAIVELQKTLSYTPIDSPDYAQVTSDLQSLQNLLNQPSSPSGEATSSAKSK